MQRPGIWAKRGELKQNKTNNTFSEQNEVQQKKNTPRSNGEEKNYR